MALVKAVEEGPEPAELYGYILAQAEEPEILPVVVKAVREASQEPPPDLTKKQGWVLLAFQNALWQLRRGADPETALADTISRGGDTDTNAAICGALLGAVWGLKSIPDQWQEKVLSCQPKKGNPAIIHPRPEIFWPGEALTLAEKLLNG
jgi:ADP-ribosylglycohydrolase